MKKVNTLFCKVTSHDFSMGGNNPEDYARLLRAAADYIEAKKVNVIGMSLWHDDGAAMFSVYEDTV